MSFLSDLFGGADNAAAAQKAGIEKGLTAATGNINQGNQALTSNYTAGLQPFQANNAQAMQGTGALGNALGLNGAAGSQSALANLQTTPGYQFQLGQGDNAINAAAAANGTLNSGKQQTDLSKFNQGLAGSTYNNYVSQLDPFLGAAQSSASGIGSMYSGLGGGLNANQGMLANMQYGGNTSMGNADASAHLADQSLGQNLLGGLGNLASSIAPMFMFSDERLKEDISPVGELFDGLGVYSYRYKGDDTPRIGLLAQEVETKYPDAVSEIGGFKAVHYGKATSMASDLFKFLDAA